MIIGFLQSIFGIVAVALIFGTAATIRSALVSRRRSAMAGGDHPGIPIRLRGLPVTYPGFWRPGYLDPTTARWWSRSRWGVPASLSGAVVSSSAPAEKRDYLPVVAQDDIVLTCLDGRSHAFQIAAAEPDVADVRRCLRVASTAGPRPLHKRVPLLRVRQYVPLTVPILLAVAVLCLAYWTLPLLGDRTVQGVVVDNRGPDSLCTVTWIDPVGNTNHRGRAECDGEAPGDPVQVHVMGWPRAGVADSAELAVILALTFGGCAVMFAGMCQYSGFLQRRRLAEAVAGRQPP
ncbi:MAG TPA: hypothetical protein VK453_04435 [Micromonosporaceae bacterium]|nr:hypothetical protein [Micromonosporaceae bacterium]